LLTLALISSCLEPKDNVFNLAGSSALSSLANRTASSLFFLETISLGAIFLRVFFEAIITKS